MSLAQLIELFDEQGRFFIKTDEGGMELELVGNETLGRVVVKEADGWTVAYVYFVTSLIPKLDDLAQEIRSLYNGHVLIDTAEDEAEGKVEIALCSYLLPTAPQASLYFFIDACNRLCPYLVEVAKRGWWDQQEFPQIAPFPLKKGEVQ